MKSVVFVTVCCFGYCFEFDQIANEYIKEHTISEGRETDRHFSSKISEYLSILSDTSKFGA